MILVSANELWTSFHILNPFQRNASSNWVSLDALVICKPSEATSQQQIEMLCWVTLPQNLCSQEKWVWNSVHQSIVYWPFYCCGWRCSKHAKLYQPKHCYKEGEMETHKLEGVSPNWIVKRVWTETLIYVCNNLVVGIEGGSKMRSWEVGTLLSRWKPKCMD